MADDGLKAVFLAERAMLTRLLTARLGSREEAEDTLQDMWFKLENLETKPVAQASAYLYRMAMNLAADRRLAASRRVSRESSWLEAQPEASEHPDIESVLITRDKLRQVEAVIATMPERMREALRLFRLEEVPQKEIAERLGISLSGVEKLLKRAYRQIHDANEIIGAVPGGRRRLEDEEE